MSRRAFLLKLLSLLLFLTVLLRLLYLQLLKFKYFRELSRKNYLRIRRLYPPRGDILSREGERLAYDVPKFFLFMDPTRHSRDAKLLIRKIFKVKVKNLKPKLPYEPVKVCELRGIRELAKFYENEDRLSGFFIRVIPSRHYPYREIFAHVLGYVGLPNEGDFERLGKRRIGPRSFVGKDGLERSLDEELLGYLGWEELMVDAYGRPVKFLNLKKPKKGKDVETTLNLKLQRICYEEFKKQGHRAGAILFLDAKSGEVLSLLSFPSFDPNQIYRKWKELNEDPLRPLFNRATMGLYSPASVLKTVITFALLEEGLYRGEVINCTGVFKLGNRTFYCWKEGGHGPVDLRSALIHSCDVFFYNFGLKLGAEKIKEYALKFSYSREIPFELKLKRGNIPDPRWKEKNLKEIWYDGDTVNLSIGQGYALTNLFEQTLMMMAVANYGKIYRPTLVKGRGGRLLLEVEGKEENFNFLRKALRGVVLMGTGVLAYSREVSIAGKTGTSEVSKTRGLEKEEIPWDKRDHGWFVGFAPYEKPKVVFGAIIEHGGSGGHSAAPLMKKILERAKREGVLEL